MVCGDSNKSSTLKELLCSISHYLIYIYWFNVYHLYKNVRFLENGWFVHCWITAPDKYFVKEWKGKTRQGSLGLYTWSLGVQYLSIIKTMKGGKDWSLAEMSLSSLFLPLVSTPWLQGGISALHHHWHLGLDRPLLSVLVGGLRIIGCLAAPLASTY